MKINSPPQPNPNKGGIEQMLCDLTFCRVSPGLPLLVSDQCQVSSTIKNHWKACEFSLHVSLSPCFYLAGHPGGGVHCKMKPRSTINHAFGCVICKWNCMAINSVCLIQVQCNVFLILSSNSL